MSDSKDIKDEEDFKINVAENWDTPNTMGDATPFMDDCVFQPQSSGHQKESTEPDPTLTGCPKKTTTSESTEPDPTLTGCPKKTTTSDETPKKTTTENPKKVTSNAPSIPVRPVFPARTDSVEKVAEFMNSLELPDLAEKLTEDAIDGEALYLLSVDDFVEYGLKRGPAIKLCEKLRAGKLWVKRRGFSSIISPRQYSRPGIAYRLIWSGYKMRTTGGLTKKDLKISKKGRIVPKRRSTHGEKLFRANLQNWVLALMKVRREMSLDGFQLVKKEDNGGSEVQAAMYRRTVELRMSLKSESLKAEGCASPRNEQRWE